MFRQSLLHMLMMNPQMLQQIQGGMSRGNSFNIFGDNKMPMMQPENNQTFGVGPSQEMMRQRKPIKVSEKPMTNPRPQNEFSGWMQKHRELNPGFNPSGITGAIRNMNPKNFF